MTEAIDLEVAQALRRAVIVARATGRSAAEIRQIVDDLLAVLEEATVEASA